MALEDVHICWEADLQSHNLLRNPSNKHALQHVLADFEAKIPDLFISDSANCKIEVVETSASSKFLSSAVTIGGYSNPDDKGNVVKWISTAEELDTIFNEQISPNSSRILILRRLNSWSRINATVEMFQAICTYNRITPWFLNIVMGFGRKFSSWDEDFMSCYNHFSSSSRGQGLEPLKENKVAQKNILTCELCYNIRHFERHGRELEDPWSCRQSAIHQSLSFDTEQSRWIIIQPPELFSSTLRGSKTTSTSHPMDLHIQYLGSAIAGWRQYLNYIAERLKLMDNEVAICKPYEEFGLNLSSKQQVHSLRRKLYHARSILANTLNTLTSIGAHEDRVAEMGRLTTSIHNYFQDELRNLRNELRNYQQTVRKLLSVSDDIRFMYEDILKLYGQELSHNNGVRLAQIAQGDSAETKVMVSLAGRTCQDSRTMRIATTVTMLYLPASLVLSFFSTTLVWFDNKEPEQSQGQDFVLRVHRETWIAVLMTLILGACTVWMSSWWERRGKTSDLEKIC